VTDADNIVRLAQLQESGELPPTAEDSIALAFAGRHAHELRYVAKWGRWLSFDGVRWQHDETLHAFDRVRDICREVAVECDKPVSAVASAKTVAAVERLAKADRRLAATSAQWDADGWLFNGNDATIDLRTGTGRAPTPADFITKMAACGCAPTGALHPLWDEFLDRVTDSDSALQEFLQRYAGYCCTGFTVEHAFVFAYGTGANGKSTFTRTIAGMLGDYATAADMSTFTVTKVEQHQTDIAKLLGARLVVANETQKGKRWDETKIKNLTGGDTVSARFMRQDFFDYVPSFKLIISGNHKPRLDSVDEAMKRRLLLVPFTVEIPPKERDPALAEKLKAEWPAILRWAVDGTLQWQRIGLAPPPKVRDATEAYFKDQDTLGQWLEDCTEDSGAFALTCTAELFASWKSWCETRNLKPGSEMSFSMGLADKGFEKTKDPTSRRMAFRRVTLSG
jgi:putative DNA primase/helicase